MALSPTIPTSFVPRPQTGGSVRRQRSGFDLFLAAGLVLFGITVVLALGVFGYQEYLERTQAAKEASLEAALKNVNTATVEEFIHLRDRLSGAQSTLDQHVRLSGLFSILESVTVESVRFDSLEIVVADDRTAKLQLAGTARTFNALASESSLIADDPRMKRAIFSGFVVNRDGTVSFTLTADVAADVVTGDQDALRAAAAAAAAPDTGSLPIESATTSTATSSEPSAVAPVVPAAPPSTAPASPGTSAGSVPPAEPAPTTP